MRRKRLPALLPLLVVALLVVAGCGGDDDEGSEEASPPAAEQDLSQKPEVEVPAGDPPSELEITDLVEGDGADATPGDVVTVNYVGVEFDSGEEFDSSWSRNEPFPFELGAGMVIPGWDEGVAGMRVGGRRMLVIPPDLAYGQAGAPPDIGPNATLVFVVDLLEVN